MTMKGPSDDEPTSNVDNTLGWFKRAAMRASFMNMLTNSASPARPGRSFLITSSLRTSPGPLVTVSTTLDIPPCPSLVMVL